MLLSDIQGEHIIDAEDNYGVKVEDGDFIILVFGAKAGKSLANFDHPNMLAKKYTIHEFKHYSERRGKWWTSSPGVDMYFAVSKDQITLVEEKGYSYPKVIIGGKEISLNVSAGSVGDGWRDYIGQACYTSVGHSKATLKAIADVAMTIREVKQAGVTIEEEDRGDNEQGQLVELVAKSVATQLGKGDKVILVGSRTFSSAKHLGQGPFEITRDRQKRKRFYKVDLGYGQGYYGMARYQDIDWTQTALVNGITLPNLIDIIRVPAKASP